MTSEEFALSPDICYLNHAAVAPWPRRTVEAVERFARDNGVYGAQHYERWLDTERALRAQLRELVNASGSDEIALLKNTSEALSVVAWGMDWKPGDEVIISDQEFPSNRIVWESLKPLGVAVKEVDIGTTDTPEAAIVERMTQRTRLVSLSSVQYSSGLALDLIPIGQACRQRGIAFCVDAIQGLGARPFDVQECQADFAMADGHKWMLGPEGLALFYCRREWLERLSLRQFGWRMVEAAGDFEARNWRPAGDARRFECGSPNMIGIHALHASLGLLLESGIPNVFRELSEKISYLIDILDNIGAFIISERDPERRAGIVTFTCPGVDTALLYRNLQQQGVVCALRGGGIRFSPHYYTPRSVLKRAVSLVEQCA